MLGDLSWRRVAGLFAGQSMIGLVGGAIAWAVHGNPLQALGPRYMLWSYRSMGMTFAMGVVATIPLLGYIWLEDALDLSSKFPNTLGAVANATKVTCLLALGSERAPLKAGIAACFLALAAGALAHLLPALPGEGHAQRRRPASQGSGWTCRTAACRRKAAAVCHTAP